VKLFHIIIIDVIPPELQLPTQVADHFEVASNADSTALPHVRTHCATAATVHWKDGPLADIGSIDEVPARPAAAHSRLHRLVSNRRVFRCPSSPASTASRQGDAAQPPEAPTVAERLVARDCDQATDQSVLCDYQTKGASPTGDIQYKDGATRAAANIRVA
jgi:hypothetical protein